MVEAALVLPIIILTIISLLMLTVYFFTCLGDQVHIHEELIASQSETQVFNIIEKSTETSRKTKGLIELMLSRKKEYRTYAIDEAKVIRGGRRIYEKLAE